MEKQHPKITITKRFKFESAHFLPQHKGKCKNWHGHSYVLDVTVRGYVFEKTGMIIDFGELKEIVQKTVVDVLDHKLLNDIFENPTAEIMIIAIAGQIRDVLPKDVFLKKVRLYETDTGWAEWEALKK